MLSLNRKLSSVREEVASRSPEIPGKGFEVSSGEGVLGMLPGVWLPLSPPSYACRWDKSSIKPPDFPTTQGLTWGCGSVEAEEDGVSNSEMTSPFSRLSTERVSLMLIRSSSTRSKRPALPARALLSNGSSRRLLPPLVRLSSRLQVLTVSELRSAKDPSPLRYSRMRVSCQHCCFEI